MKTIKIDFSDQQTKDIVAQVIAQRMEIGGSYDYSLEISEDSINGAIKEAVQFAVRGQIHGFQNDIKKRIRSLIDSNEDFITMAMVRKAMEPFVASLVGNALTKPLKDKIKAAVLNQIQSLDVKKS